MEDFKADELFLNLDYIRIDISDDIILNRNKTRKTRNIKN